MWIRNQNKMFLLNIDNAHIVKREFAKITNYSICCCHKGIDIDLGIYSTKEKALKVLDSMHTYLNRYVDEKDCSVFERVFEILQDSEVE